MQSKIRSIATLSVVMAIVIASCKKTDSNTTTTTDPTTELTSQVSDQSNVSASNDAVENDVNNVLNNTASFNGREANTLGILCNATTVADSSNGLRRITITYNGANCAGNRTLTGVVVISMPIGSHWKDTGAVMTLTQNLTITKVSDGKSIVISGSKTITNVTGGRLVDLPKRGTITHLIAGADSITFDNGKQRIWQVAKQRVFTYDNGVVISTTGTHTDGTVTGIAEWGTNRYGNAFETAISQPMVIREDCEFRLVSGTQVHSKLAATVTVTFGLDSTGAPTGCPLTGSYYYKAVWVGTNGVTKTVILPY